MHLLVEGLNLHCIAVSWDLQYLQCLAEASRAKTATVAVKGMPSGVVASKTGKLFYDTIKVKRIRYVQRGGGHNCTRHLVSCFYNLRRLAASYGGLFLNLPPAPHQ